MSGSREKLIKKKVDARVGEHIDMFVDSVCRLGFKERFVFTWKIIFKRLKMDNKSNTFKQIKKHYAHANAPKISGK